MSRYIVVHDHQAGEGYEYLVVDTEGESGAEVKAATTDRHAADIVNGLNLLHRADAEVMRS